MYKFNFAVLMLLLPLAIVHGASGTWTRSTSSVWELDSNWSGVAYPNATADDATFDDTASAFDPTLSTTVDVNDITFSNNSNSYTLSGGTIRLNNPGADIPTIQIGGSQTVSASNNFNLNSTALEITGSGSGLFTHTGTITTSGSSTISKSGNATFFINGSDNSATISNDTKWVINAGEIRIDGNSTLGSPTVLANDYITINGGTLAHSGTDKTTLNGFAGITVGASGATFHNRSTNNADFQFNAPVSGSSGGDINVVSDGTGYVIFNYNFSTGADGNLILGNSSGNQGRVAFKRLERIPSGNIIFNTDNLSNTTSTILRSIDADGGTISQNIVLERPGAGTDPRYEIQNNQSGQSILLSGNITSGTTYGSGNITYLDLAGADSSTYTLTGSNDFTGVQRIRFRQINGGASTMNLKLGNANAFNNLDELWFHQTLADGVTMRLVSTVTGTYTTNLTDQSGLRDNATIVIGGEHSTGNVTYSGTISLNKVHSGSNNTTLQLHAENSGTTSTFTGVISDNPTNFDLNVESTGNGRVIVNADNTYHGTTTITDGTMEIQHADALGDTGSATLTTIQSGGTLALNNASSMTIDNETLSLSGTGDSGAGAIDVVDGSHTISGAITLSADSSVDVSNADDILTLSGVISGSGGFTKTGVGSLVISNNNTYTGSTTISSGSLNLSGSIDGNLVINGGAVSGGTNASAVAAALTISSGSITANSDASTGIFNVTGGASSSWTGGSYIWNVSSGMGSSGTDADGNGYFEASGADDGSLYDIIAFSGALDFTGASAGSITLKLDNSDTYTGYSFNTPTEIKIATYGSVVNFNESFFNIDSSSFNDSVGSWWLNWGVSSHSGSLWLTYTAVPEPGTYFMLFSLLIFVTFRFFIFKKNRK